MRITSLVAPPTADPQDWMDWLSAVAMSLGLPDPLPDRPAPQGPDGPLPVDPNYIQRSTIIPLSAFPELLRPPGVPVERRSLALTMTIRRALYSHQTGVDGDGRPTFATEDRGWECDIAIYPGPGRWWDVELLPDIITMSVMTNGVVGWETVTRGLLELPCTPHLWARVNPAHPTVRWATYQSPTVVVDMTNIPAPPGGP